jgi:hypothetical protein
MSSFGSLAEMEASSPDVRFTPESRRPSARSACPLCAISGHRVSLFDHLVGTGAHRRRHGEAKRFSGLEIDHQFVLGWRLYWQVGRLLALEDAIDVASRAPKLVNEIRPIRNQSAGGNIIAFLVDAR